MPGGPPSAPCRPDRGPRPPLHQRARPSTTWDDYRRWYLRSQRRVLAHRWPRRPQSVESARHLLVPDPLPERVLELPGTVSRRRACVRGRAAVLGGAGGRLVRK